MAWPAGGRVPVPGSEPDHTHWMNRALQLARVAEQQGEVPVGALLVRDGLVLGEGHNQPILASDPTAHAEIVALRAAARGLGNYRLVNTTLYVTLEPCTMCMGAIIHARVGTLVFGAREPRAGAAVSQLGLAGQAFYNHHVSVVEGVLASECGELVAEFFRKKRG